MVGLSLLRSEIPETLIAQRHLQNRLTRRSDQAVEEIRFLWRVRHSLLPVWYQNELSFFEWGNKDRSNRLPCGSHLMQEELKNGCWRNCQRVEVPANFGLANHVWFHVIGGFQGILIHDHSGGAHVYLLTQPASHYYEVMTRSKRMPLFIGQGI